MRILYYNWAPINSLSLGGGVNVYMRNLVSYLESQTEEQCVEVFFLSSGWFYDGSKKPYIRNEGKVGVVKCYTIINSPIIAPQRFAMSQPSVFFNDQIIRRLFNSFIKENGPFDVIHFQSLEGLSPKVLELKSDNPNTRFVYSIHDYGLFCPSVRLWTDKSTNCYTDKEKRECSKCMGKYKTARFKSLETLLRPSNINIVNHNSFVKKLYTGIIYRVNRYLCKYQLGTNQNEYLRFREQNVDMINHYIDTVLCVSGRVAEIANHYGVNKEKLKVCYIGTKVAETAIYRPCTSENTVLFTLLYY